MRDPLTPQFTRAFARAIPLAIPLALALAGCGAAVDRTSDGIHVVTTVAPITNIVHNVAGELVRVTGIVPEGVNSHTFQPAPSDARALGDADVVIVNGLNLEVPTIELARANIGPDTEIISLAERTITPDDYIFDFSFPADGGDPNPHLWTNPKYVESYADAVADVLADLDPENADTYRSNARAYNERVGRLDNALREATKTVPKKNRVLLTYHDSFPYMAREYGWTIIGAIQPSDFSDPSPREVADLIDQIRARKVPAIFGSEVFPSPVSAQIARESGATYVEELRDDDLPGESGDEGHSLLGLLVFDFHTIVQSLGGDSSAFRGIDVANLSPGSMVSYG